MLTSIERVLGVLCTLIGTVRKGQAFDAMKMKDLEVHLSFDTYVDWVFSFSLQDTQRCGDQIYV